MPAAPFTLSLIIASALGIPVAAMATTVAPSAPDSWTLVGAAFAVFSVVTLIRTKNPTATASLILFNVGATIGVGWFFPEVVAQHVLRVGDLSNKTWAALAFVCGLGGAAFVSALLVMLNRRIPKAVDRMADKLHLGNLQDDPPTVKLHEQNGDSVKNMKGTDTIKWCKAERE